MYKYSTDYLPNVFNAYIRKRSQIHNRKTRNMTNYNLKKNRTNFASKGVKTSEPVFGTPYQRKLNYPLMLKYLESN